MRVEATDADDPDEPRNTKLFYSIRDELFTIEPETGIIRTTICCLDRELTPHLDLQVTATDPGGLRGEPQDLRVLQVRIDIISQAVVQCSL